MSENDFLRKLRETYQGQERQKAQKQGDQRVQHGLPRQQPIDYSSRRQARPEEIRRIIPKSPQNQ